MNLIDYIVLIPLCWFAFMGFRKGLIYELTSILALVLGVWASYRFSDSLALWLPNMPFAKQISFALTFFIVLFLVHLAGKLMCKVVKLVIPGAVDHIFGLLFGIGKVLLVFSVIFYMIEMIDSHEIIIKKETKENSLVYEYVEPIVPHALEWEKIIHDDCQDNDQDNVKKNNQE